MSTAAMQMAGVEQLLAAFPRGDASYLIPALQQVQGTCGYLPEQALKRVEDHLGVPMPRIYGVATFYAQFHFAPHGRHTVRTCCGTACHVRGAREVRRAAETALGIREGETTHDLEYSLETVACLGTCFLAPVAMIDDRYYGRLTPRRMSQVLAPFRSA